MRSRASARGVPWKNSIKESCVAGPKSGAGVVRLLRRGRAPQSSDADGTCLIHPELWRGNRF